MSAFRQKIGVTEEDILLTQSVPWMTNQVKDLIIIIIKTFQSRHPKL